MSDHLPPAGSALRVFVYGTLKCGYGNHSRLCREYAGRAVGVVCGRVVDRPEGFPTLFVPVGDILASGTSDLAGDCRLIAALENDAAEAGAALANLALPAPYRCVTGELYTFDDGADRLRTLDLLEDFYPGGPSMYCRVALPVRTSQGIVPSWAYISPHSARFEAEHAGPP